MKPWLFLVAISASPVLPLAAQAQASPDSSALSLPDPTSVFDWKFRPLVGSRYQMRVFQKTAMRMTIPAMPEARSKAQRITMSASQRMVMDYDVLSRDALNATTVRLTYRAFSGGGAMIVEGNPALSAASQARADKAGRALNTAFEGAVLMMKIAPDGKVWSLRGLSALRSRVANVLRGDPMQKVVLRAMSNAMDEAAMKHLFEQSGAQLPPYPVAVNDGWSYKIDLPLNMAVLNERAIIQGHRQLAARRAGRASINERGSFDIDMKTPTGSATAPDTQSSGHRTPVPALQAALKGSMRGITEVDEASGLPMESNISIILGGKMSMAVPVGPHQKPRPISVPLALTISTRTTFTPVAADSSQ